MLPHNTAMVSFQMALLKDNKELCDRLSTAIAELVTSGELLSYSEEYLGGYLAEDKKTVLEKADPTPIEPTFTEGLPTLRMAITGDVAPLDYVTADGKPAGFNVALSTKIGEKLGYNIEFVLVTADARAAALSSGKADVVFWFQSPEEAALSSESLVFTRSYYSCKRTLVGKYSSAEELEKAFNEAMNS